MFSVNPETSPANKLPPRWILRSNDIVAKTISGILREAHGVFFVTNGRRVWRGGMVLLDSQTYV